MQKFYIVRLSDEERQICLDIVKTLKGSSQKVRRANILLKGVSVCDDRGMASGGRSMDEAMQ